METPEQLPPEGTPSPAEGSAPPEGVADSAAETPVPPPPGRASFGQRVSLVLGLMALLAVGAWATHHNPPPQPMVLPSLGQVPDFTLVNQDGKAVRRTDLLGTPWIVDFIYTSCTDFCPAMTEEMGKLRRALGSNSPVRTVSITVDPMRDKPGVLQQYARKHGAVDPHWYYLTGDFATIGRVLVGLHLASERDVARADPGLHNTRFILVDAQGQVRGYYAHDDAEARDRLLKDARSLEGVRTAGTP